MILFIAIAHSIQIFRNANYQDRESSLFNRNACALQFELSVPQSNISETSNSEASEYVHIKSHNSAAPTHDPTWSTY